MALAQDKLSALLDEFEGISPYPGLRPFLEQESRFFKGRDAQVREITERLARESCVTVIGGSGCGKSSIVRAGVIPALRKKRIPCCGDIWRIGACTPGRDPIGNLVRGLEQVLRPAASASRSQKIREVLYGAHGLGGFLPAFGKELDATAALPAEVDTNLSTSALERANVLILMDQFEELFRDENHGKTAAADLVALIVDFWRRRQAFPGLYIVLTIRSDDLHRCAEFIDLPEFINATSYLTRRLKENELRQAIVAPARPPMFRAGLLKGGLDKGEFDTRPYDVEVVTQLLDTAKEIADDPDHLPLLQHLLAVLWRCALDRWRRQSDAAGDLAEPSITLADLAQALGFETWCEVVNARQQSYRNNRRGWILRHCLEYVADELYTGDIFGNALTESQRRITQAGFCLMGDVDDRGNFKRRWTTRAEIAHVAGLNEPGNDTEAFIHRFTQDHHLLWVRTSGDIDVSHEALMRNWPRLARWLIENRNAGLAYLQLVDCYESWQQANQKQNVWWSLVRRENGLLKAHQIEQIDPLLRRKSKGFSRLASRYNGFWAQRFVTSDQLLNNLQEPTRTNTPFRNHFNYLQLSLIKYYIVRAFPLVITFIFLILTVWIAMQQMWIAKQKTNLVQVFEKAMKQENRIRATKFWNELDKSGTPIANREYVDTLWNVALAERDIRTAFVAQLPEGKRVYQMAFRPSPIVRAIGLRWTPDAQQIVSNAITDMHTGLDRDSGTKPAIVACATAVLGDRFDSQKRNSAIEHLESLMKADAGLDGKKLWMMGRVLACIGNELQPETREIAQNKIIEAAQQAGGLRGPELARMLSATAVGLGEFMADGNTIEPPKTEILSNAIDAAIKSLHLTKADWEAVSISRSLVQLIALFPTDAQYTPPSKLLFILDRINKLDKPAHPDILLILAQAFELVANRASHKDTLELIKRANIQTAGEPVNRVAMARLLVPWVKDTSAFDALLRDTSTIEAAADDEMANSLAAAGRYAQASGLYLGLSGRLRARSFAAQRAQDPASEMTRLARELKPIERSDAAGNFAREGLAHALAALAPQLEGLQRKTALQIAKAMLAQTGSAEEAAAWATAIINLLQDREDAQFVEAIIEVLKYPTAALTAREPNALAPKNATDILAEALVERLELKLPYPAARRPGSLQKILDETEAKFPAIDLTKTPHDPRVSAGADG